MSNLCLIAASLVTQGQAPGWQLALPPTDVTPTSAAIDRLCQPAPRISVLSATATAIALHYPEFSQREHAIPVSYSAPLPPTRPTSGSQLYRQRLAALEVGKIYTRIPTNSFQTQWQTATHQPTYQEWTKLLAQEAKAVARGQGSSRLTVLVGDSLAMWFPPERMSSDRLWLNQGISGDTTTGVLRRLSLFNDTHPTAIHVMAGINDLRHGASDAQVLSNLQQIMQRLRQSHPDAQIYVYSILPTRLPALPSDRIRRLNQAIAAATRQAGVSYLDMQSTFADDQGNLRRVLTTDGLHLSALGYELWQLVMLPVT